nr:restriction endonuclease subunit S [uncultured Halomonas sp.]
MSADYFKTTIGTQLTLQRGFDITRKQQQPGTVPVVSSGGVSSFHNEPRVAAPGVVLGRKGSLGTTFLLQEDFWPHDTTLWVKDFKDNNPVFVYYFFLNMSDVLKKMDVGAANPALNRNHVHPIEVLWPVRHVQDQIAEILSALDRKVENNRQINQTLEQMAQAIFKSWFVDFEPVKAKIAALEAGGSQEDALLAAMQVISGKAVEELTRLQTENPKQYTELHTTAELFPSAMQESELGEIPEGWATSTVGHEFDITMGQSPPGDTYNETGDGIPFFQGRRDFCTRFPSYRVYCTQPKRMANSGDTLLSVRAPVGDTNIAASDCCIGRGLAALRHKSNCSSFTYYSVIQLGHKLSSYDSEGTVFGSINQKNLKAIEVPKPPVSLIERFSAGANPLDNQIKNLSKQASSLEELRDSLLPKLLSGELKIPEAKELAEESTA